MVIYGDLARLEFFQGMSFILAFWCKLTIYTMPIYDNVPYVGILIGVYNLAQHEKLTPVTEQPPTCAHDAVKPLFFSEAYQTLLETPVLYQRSRTRFSLIDAVRNLKATFIRRKTTRIVRPPSCVRCNLTRDTYNCTMKLDYSSHPPSESTSASPAP